MTNQKDIVKLNSDKYRNQVEAGLREPITRTNTGQPVAPVQQPKPQQPVQGNISPDLQKAAANYLKQQPPSNDADLMPNSEKLTPLEHWIYGKLPGFSQSTVGKALESFSKTGVGKLLSYLDVAAEGLERTIGLGVQLVNAKPGEDINLANAWYAGSLTADTTNLPIFVYGDNPNKGKILNPANPNQIEPDKIVIGMRIPHDLPGTVDGLAEARQKIGIYVSQGMSEHDALAKVRDEYNSGLGALALRSQLHDTYFHIVADPLNYILPGLKPVEALQARRVVALTEKVTKSAEEIYAMEKLARAAGNIAEADKLLSTAQKVESGAIKVVNTADKFAIFMTGGDVFNPSKLSKAIEKVPILNAFQLTPASKANELISVLTDNIGQKFIAGIYNDADAEAKFMELMQKASTTAVTDYGHAMLTVEGRAVQGFLGGADTALQPAFQSYMKVENERNLLQILSRALDDTPANLLKEGEQSSATLFRTLVQKAQADPVVADLLKNGVVNENTFSDLSGIFAKGDIAFDKETFFVHAQSIISDNAMRQAVIQFGVEPTKFLNRWSNAMKSAESLAFMRLNPSYGIRNLVNNEVTMLSRGVWGLMTPEEIGNFWTDVGYKPARLMEGFSAGGDIEKGANKVLQDALKGGNYGAPEKIQDFFRKVNLGKVDMTSWSRGMESYASERAMTKGYQQFWNEYWKPVPVEKHLDTATIDAVNKIQPEIFDRINSAFKSSYGSETKLEKLLGENLNLSVDSVIEQASKNLGTDVKQILGDEIISYLDKGLPEAIKNGKVNEFVFSTRQKIDAHLEDLFQKNLDNLIGNTKNQVAAGGYPAIYDKTGEVMDMFWGGHEEHALRTPDLTRAAREADAKTAHGLWIQYRTDSDRYFNRLFGRTDAYLQGLEQGAKEAGIKFPQEVRQAFKEFQNNWKGFFEFKNTEQEAFFKARLEGKEYKIGWDDLQAQLDKKYQDAAVLEDKLMQGVDESIAQQIGDPQMQATFMAYRDELSLQRQAYKEYVANFYKEINNAPADARQAMYNEFSQTRAKMLSDIHTTDRAGLAMMNGDPQAAQMFRQTQADFTVDVNGVATPAEQKTIYQLAQEYGIPSASPSGARNDRRILNTVNKYTTGEKYKNVADIPNDIAQAAFEARAAEKGVQPGQRVSQAFIADYKKVVPNLQPVDLGLDSNAYGRQYSALDALIESAKTQASKEPTLLKNLPSDLKEKVLSYIDLQKGQLGDGRLAATRFGEFRRDAALLNYNRRTNFDTMLGNFLPYSFWTTHSMFTWAIESIDRPAMLTTYLRTKKFLETAGSPQQGFPSRFKDNIRVNLPFMPDWMGEQFVNPLRLVLPFDAFIQPFEQMQQAGLKTEGAAVRLLDSQFADGKITQAQYDQAVQSKTGPVWEMAVSQAQENDNSLKFDAYDFASLMSSPHAPIVWAYNAAKGTPEEIGPFSPMSRMVKNVATMLGVKDWNNSPANLEGKIRKQLGLPAYDKWDTYRTDRMLSNMSTEGKYSVDEIRAAMILNDEITQGLPIEKAKQDPSYQLYLEATQRANQESMGGTLGGILGFFGVNIKGYPEGEKQLRALQDDFSLAYDKYNKANDALESFIKSHPDMNQKDALALFEKQNPKTAQDASALTDFFNKHPEYETRLGLFDKPEERLRKMLIDQTWGQWNQLPKVNQDELKTQLGPQFADAFLNKDTRSYDSLTTNQMQMWTKLMGGKPVGTMSAEQSNLIDLFSGQLRLTKPETAWRAQVFYDTRTKNFPDYYDKQTAYYDLPAGKRRQYLAQNPELAQYWNFRRDFMANNPDLVPYLTDDPKAIEKAQKADRTKNATPTYQELQAQGYTYQDWEKMLPTGVADIIVEYRQNNREIPSYVMDAIQNFSVENNVSRRDIMQSVIDSAGVK